MYTIGYDFNDTIIQVDELRFSVRLFTERNAYAPDPNKIEIERNGSSARLIAKGLSWAGNQEQAEGEMELHVSMLEDGSYMVRASGKHTNEICKSMLVQVYGINVTSIEFDQERISGFTTNRDIKVKRYPHEMKMPLIFIEDRHEQTWFALSKDSQLQAKAFASHYDPYTETQVLDLSHEADKRYRTNELIMPEWHVGRCTDKNSVIKERCDDLEKHFNLVPFEKREDTPEWLKDIKLVTILHGEHWTGHVFNTFSDMERTLEWIAERMEGHQVLAFLPGWDGRYYYNYPEYQPSERMGGEAGMKSLVEKARNLGIKVVPMLGANNANIEIMNELGLGNAVIKDAWELEKRCDWVDWDYDLFTENNAMLANMGHPGYRKHMLERSEYLMKQFHVDGLFLDITIWWENDPDYSPYEGLIQWAKEMKSKYPDMLLFGENSYDALWGVFSLFHEKGHPAGHGYALYRYALQTHYLAYPAPGMGSGGIHEFAWDENGPAWERDVLELIPTLSVVGDTLTHHPKAAEAIIHRAKSWNPIKPGIV